VSPRTVASTVLPTSGEPLPALNPPTTVSPSRVQRATHSSRIVGAYRDQLPDVSQASTVARTGVPAARW
jgi:hypothetical protein